MANIVVLGAGVSGLTTALLLARKGHKVSIVAKHMPGDYDIEYASPWAGANSLPVAKPGSKAQQYETDTWYELEKLATNLPEAGVHFQNNHIYRRAKDADSAVGDWFKELIREDAWFKDVLPNFRVLDKSELPPGIDSGTGFTSVCINTALYLPWLASQCLKLGATLYRGDISHISEAASLHHSGSPAKLVINCTGLYSLRLGGVQDTKLYPARGQIVVVRNDPGIMCSTSGTDDGSDEACYIMHRAAGGGTVPGGCLQAGNWESQVDPNLAIRIMKRAVALCPALVKPGQGIEGLDIVRHGVGLRPMRTGGIRVEKERIGDVDVVHNYGHGGYGYQTSFGCSMEVLKLVNEVRIASIETMRMYPELSPPSIDKSSHESVPSVAKKRKAATDATTAVLAEDTGCASTVKLPAAKKKTGPAIARDDDTSTHEAITPPVAIKREDGVAPTTTLLVSANPSNAAGNTMFNLQHALESHGVSFNIKFGDALAQTTRGDDTAVKIEGQVERLQELSETITRLGMTVQKQMNTIAKLTESNAKLASTVGELSERLASSPSQNVRANRQWGTSE
ncbi:D-amino acid oxidase [Oleoguttula sp. CCFEE 5521]